MVLELLIVASIIFIVLIFLMVRYKELTVAVREICAVPSGYFKFGQITLLFFSITSFLLILIYDFFNPRNVSSIDVILTVTVGALGTVIGLFFGGKAEKHITDSRKEAIIKESTKHKEVRIITQRLVAKIIELEKDMRNKIEQLKK